MAWLLTWQAVPPAQLKRHLARRIAYLWRYGRGGGLRDILATPTDFLELLGSCLEEIVREENKPPPSRS